MSVKMEKGFGQSDPNVVQYAEDLLKPEDEVLQWIREESTRKGLPPIQVGSFDGLHLEVLVRMSGAKRAVEIGTLGGYSGVCIARGLGQAGSLETFEFNPTHAEVAMSSFLRAGVSDRVKIHVGPALENLPKIESQGPFDLVFIDADKANYVNYLNWATAHLRIGGVVIADNTFAWNLIHLSKDVPKQDEKSVRSLREFNEAVIACGRYRVTMLPTAEGLTLAVKTS